VAGLAGWFAPKSTSQAQPEIDIGDYRTTMFQLLGGMLEARRGRDELTNILLLDQIVNSNDPLYIAPLLDLAFFARAGDSNFDIGIFAALQNLTGQAFGQDWQAYFEWASAENIALPPHYDEFKGAFFAAFIDPEFHRFFRAGVQDTARVNMVEILWGGVAVDGIPSLVNAKQITPEEAIAEGLANPDFCREGNCIYPAPDEYVFGVSIDGDNRAYPLRILNWHEMFNDVLGKAPLYDAPDGTPVCDFRAPTEFKTLARHGEEWVQIEGYSAGCPAGGWLQTEAVDWEWATVRDQLPDVAKGAEALLVDEGISGRVKGRPVMLAYCTLCGTGILYEVTIPNLVVDGISLGETVLEFGSTGLLMRSNKVMYDRNTNTAWNAMTGEPAFGPLAESGIALPQLPVVVTDWATWLEDHPNTSVLSLNTGYNRRYANGAAYTDYFNDPTFLMFPVWQQDTSQQENKEVVFALLVEDIPKAYPLKNLIPNGVTNDTIGSTNLVILSRATLTRDFFEPGGASVRAYQRGDHIFSVTDNRNEIIDENGVIWEVTEDALLSSSGERLARLPGHLSFWFGWYGYYPNTLVYAGA
jgi:hypothetical protein